MVGTLDQPSFDSMPRGEVVALMRASLERISQSVVSVETFLRNPQEGAANRANASLATSGADILPAFNTTGSNETNETKISSAVEGSGDEEPSTDVKPEPMMRRFLLKCFSGAWCVGEMSFWVGMFILDIVLVVRMMLFLESIGGKYRRTAVIMSKQKAEVTAAMQSTSGKAAGTPIPAPTAAVDRDSTQWLAWLSQEEFLAAWLKEHWSKFALGLALAVVSRLPQYLLDKEGLLFHMIINLAVTMRVASFAVLLLLRDDVLLPKRAVTEPAALPRLSRAPPPEVFEEPVHRLPNLRLGRLPGTDTLSRRPTPPVTPPDRTPPRTPPLDLSPPRHAHSANGAEARWPPWPELLRQDLSPPRHAHLADGAEARLPPCPVSLRRAVSTNSIVSIASTEG